MFRCLDEVNRKAHQADENPVSGSLKEECRTGWRRYGSSTAASSAASRAAVGFLCSRWIRSCGAVGQSTIQHNRAGTVDIHNVDDRFVKAGVRAVADQASEGDARR